MRGFSGGADVRATLEAVRVLGARATCDDDVVRVEGAGLELGAGRDVHIDCANSGTTMRLGMGVVAGVGASCTLDGDASLRRRPMERVAEPLRAMGAAVETTAGRAPVRVRGGALAGLDYALRGGERAAQVGRPARWPARARPHAGAGAAAEPGSHRADARALRCPAGTRRGQGGPGRRAAPARGRGPGAGRSVVGGVPAGGRIAGPGLGGARARRRAQPDADRCARDPASHGSRHPRRGRARRGRASRAATCSCGRRACVARASPRRRSQRPSTSCRCWRSPPPSPRARRASRAPGSCA